MENGNNQVNKSGKNGAVKKYGRDTLEDNVLEDIL